MTTPFHLTAARRLAEVFARTAAHHDCTGEFPHDNIARLHASGLLSLVTAREHGGQGLGLAEAQSVVSEIARGEPSTALVLAMHYNHQDAIRRGMWPRHLAERVSAAARHGPALINAAQAEPGIGSPAHGGRMATVAHRTATGWRIDGAKSFVTGIPALKWVTVLARTEEEEPRLAIFLVPTDAPGLSVREVWQSAGMHATASHEIVLDGVEVGEDEIVASDPLAGPALRTRGPAHYFFTLIAATYHGVALAARDRILDHAAHHVPGALGAPLATLPHILDGLGEIEVKLTANARLLASIAADVDAGRDIGQDDMIVRHLVVDNAIAVTTKALELAGNPGLQRSEPYERHLRDVHAARAHAPQNHIIRANAARRALTQRAEPQRAELTDAAARKAS